jgi:hypothetical protein
LPTKVVCEIALLAMLGTAGLTGSIYALMRTLVPKPRSLGQINSRTEKRNQGIISELLPPEVETLNDLGNSLVSYAVAASQMSVMAADATDQEESRALANLVQVQIRNYRVLAERRDRILARLEQVQLRHDILTSSLIFMAGLMIAAAAFIPASVKSRSKIESPRIFVLHPAVEEAQERWSRLGVEPCAVGREKELAVAWTGADPPSAGSLVTTLGFPEECRRVSLILPTWVTITALNMEKSQ